MHVHGDGRSRDSARRCYRQEAQRLGFVRHWPQHGFIFLSIEDETEISNAIDPDLYERNRSLVTYAKFLMIEGVLQNLDKVIHIRAKRQELALSQRQHHPIREQLKDSVEFVRWYGKQSSIHCARKIHDVVESKTTCCRSCRLSSVLRCNGMLRQIQKCR
jgi:hypothetical protein